MNSDTAFIRQVERICVQWITEIENWKAKLKDSYTSGLTYSSGKLFSNNKDRQEANAEIFHWKLTNWWLSL